LKKINKLVFVWPISGVNQQKKLQGVNKKKLQRKKPEITYITGVKTYEL